jgi:hypothetical protein
MGVQKPELEALTKLFKVCLENAIGLYDDLDSDEAYYEDDNENDLTIDNEDESIDDDIFHAGGVDASTLADNLSERTTPDPADDIAEFEDEIPETKRTESTAGTTLADAYVKVAPKLLDRNLCKPSDIDNMGKFIDWLINKFNSFDSDKYMRQAESIAGRRNSYNTDRMDKCLSVIGSGTYVVQLLNDIAAAFHDKLRQATLSSESSIFSLAKDINNFVANQFDATVTSDISTYEKGFYDTSDDDSHEATPEERMAAEKMLENPSAKDTKQKSNVDRFSSDTTVESVDTSLADFVSFIPSSDMSDRDAADFNKPISKEKKKRAKLLTNQRAAFANAHKGDVVETSSLDVGDDPWADL